jgi:hypothetical protein
MGRPAHGPQTPRYVCLGIWAALICCVVAQVFIDASYVNLCAVLIAAIGGAVTSAYLFRTGVFAQAPISSLMIFGLNFTLVTGPLIFQTLDWRSFTFNLDVPLKTIGIAVSLSLLALITHLFYRGSPSVRQLRAAFGVRVLSPFGVFRPPSDAQLWMMGFIGLAAMWFTGTPEAKAGIEYGDVSGKFFQALIPFTVAPFLIPAAGALFRPGRSTTAMPWLLLAGYFALLLGVALARNSRGAFSSVLLVLGLCLLLAALMRGLRIERRAVAAIVIVGAMGVPLLGALSDVSTAMLINRSARDEVSAPELMRRTMEVMGDKQALELYRARSEIISAGYSEVYIRNNFFQRLTLLKFLDLTLKNSEQLSEDQTAYARQAFVNKLIGVLPTPVISAFGLKVDKRDLRYSGGDLYRFLASRGRLGGFVTGSAIADGLVLMGPLFWPACVLFFGVSFFLFDAYTRPIRNFGLIVSPVVLMGLDRLLMFGLNGESVAGTLSQLIRGYPQSLLLYSALFFVTLGISSVLAVAPGGSAQAAVHRPRDASIRQ